MKQAKVLTIDDSFLIRHQVRIALEEGGFEVHEAADGASALALLDAHSDYRLIVTDFSMPQMNGIELLEAIRRRPAYARTPVLVLSTQSDSELVRKAWELGIKGWIRKPFKAEFLLSAVRGLVS